MHTSFGKDFDTFRLSFMWIDLSDENHHSAKIASDNIEQLCKALGAGSDKHKRNAIRWLYYAQTTGIAPGCIEHIREHLKQGSWTLADIGTSEDGLKTVVRDYEAKKQYDYA